jgi:peptidoglycan-associated lipoprotein
MKKNVLCLTTLAVAVMLSTGCRHKPINVTPIPGPNSSEVGTPPPAPPYNPGMGGGGETPIAPTSYNPDNFNKDTTKLAAYTVHFAFDSAVIRDSEHANLQAVATELQQNPNEQLEVDGNCDERGTDEYNRSLGERRALAAREALAGMGIDASRVHEISYGKDKPVDPGHDEAAWAKNRRDDFVVLTPKAGM